MRRAQAAESCFGVAIRRDPQGWGLEGDSELLALERMLHQRARVLGHRPLRLHAPFWSLRAGLGRLPPGWSVNPANATAVCENPLDLLRQRVIDAALLTPTQMPASCEGLPVLELQHSPIELALFAPADPSQALARFECLRSSGELVLRSPSFLPRSCLRRCRDWFKELLEVSAAVAQEALAASASAGAAAARRPAPADTAELSVAFLTPEMQRVRGLPARWRPPSPHAPVWSGW